MVDPVFSPGMRRRHPQEEGLSSGGAHAREDARRERGVSSIAPKTHSCTSRATDPGGWRWASRTVASASRRWSPIARVRSSHCLVSPPGGTGRATERRHALLAPLALQIVGGLSGCVGHAGAVRR